MRKYTFLLFDADNTLLDFDENERVSIINTFGKFGLPCNEKTLKLYHEINISYWAMLAENRVTREELLIFRFQNGISRLSCPVSGYNDDVVSFFGVNAV